MKKKVLPRIIGIGIFHMVLYLYFVPFVIFPKFGKIGFEFVVTVSVIISIAVIGTILLEKINKRGKK